MARTQVMSAGAALAAALLVVGATSYWRPPEAAPARRGIAPAPFPSSRSALESTFARDIRNLVYRWSADDLTPQRNRQSALFAFVYQTYDTSAWIPHSLF